MLEKERNVLSGDKVSWKRKTVVGAARLHRNFTTKTEKKGKMEILKKTSGLNKNRKSVGK